MVEAALEKLRLERENRSKLKQQQAIGGPSNQPPSSRRDDGGKQPAGAGYRQASPTPFLNNQPPPQPKSRVSDAVFAPNSAVNQRDRYSQQPAGIGAGVDRRISGKAAIDAAQEENRRRDEDRTKAREDERQRYEAHVKEEMRLRDEAATKQKADQLQAQADAVVRRDQLRERERARQREEIDQLKRDKIELDRR